MCGKVNGMDNELQTNYTTEQTYHSIRHSIVSAQRSLCTAVNSAMVTAYWEIGEQIYKACGENDRAGYFTYLPTEEGLKRELRLDEFQKLYE